MEKSVERTQRTFIRLLFGILLGVILLTAAIWGGHNLYIRWQEKRLVRRATLDLQQGNDRDANLAARSILEMKPSSAAAARIMAELSERAGERSALEWRRKAAQLAPQSVDDGLALVRSAVQFNDIATAERALAAVDPRARDTAPYHEASAMVAQSKHQDEKADAEWNEALRLSPEDKSFQLQLGIVRLRSHDPQRRAAGEAMLAALRSDPAKRSAATRALMNEGLTRHDDAEKLLNLARELQSYPEATWNDRFVYLDFLHRLQDPKFSEYLTEIEKSAPDNASSLAQLLSWMSKNNLSLVALDYSKRLPPDSLRNWPVPFAIADAHVQLHEWQNLEATTAKANWGRFDFLRRAYLSLALRKQDKPAAADREWTAAQKEASIEPQFLSMLSGVTSEWGWQKETTELLWTLAKQPQTELEALQSLYQIYANASDTPGLYRVLVRLVEIQPEDLRVQNNFAQISLVLNVDVEQARKFATELYRKERSNPAYVSTYAFALYTKGDTSGALKVMGELSEAQLRDPSVAAYYGILLAANGDAAKAREYFKIGASAKLLPEERALITKAEKSLK